MLVNSIQNNVYNNNNNNFKISHHKLSFLGAKEDFGQFLTKDIFQKEVKTVTRSIIDKSILENLKKAITDILSRNNLIGSGYHGRVYKIDDNFVMKISKHYTIPTEIENETIKLSKNKFSKLQTYYGEDLLSIGSASILKNAGKHITAGIPNRIDPAETKTYYNTKYLPTFAKVPQESYDAIAEDFAKLNKITTKDGKYYCIDSLNPENIILSKDKLMLVDEFSSEDNQKNPNTVGKFVELLLYHYDVFSYVRDYGRNVNDAKEILRKILIASEKAELPYFEDLSDDITTLYEVFLNCDIKIKPFELSHYVTQLRTQIPNTSERLEVFKTYLDKNNI